MTHWVSTMIDAPLSSELVGQTINFHGPQLQKIWEGERGEDDLQNMAIKADFSAFQQRQKTLNFQDRGKRLKLQQFVVRNANSLFDLSFTEGHSEARKVPGEEDCYAALPPYETFLPLDRSSRVRHFFQNCKLGNIVIGTILSKTANGLMVKVLSIEDGDRIRFVGDLQIKAFCPVINLIPAVDKKKVSRTYLLNDAVCCEVIEVVPEADKLVLGMKGSMLPPGSDQHSRLGLIFSEDFPDVFRRIQDRTNESFDTLLKSNVAFNNPGSTTFLATSMGLQNKNYSHIGGLRSRFPETEYASELRQVQASKWAFRSVADGIDHFKAGRHTEAFQCLNKALNIDPRNIEGLVARGALYANSGSFSKAIEDFEASLKLNPNHQNARKYMGETLVALGRSYEDDNKLDEALKSYEKCLSIVPFHEEATSSITFIKKKMTDVSGLPGITPTKSLEIKDTLKQLLKVDQEEEEPLDKHKRKSKKKKERKSRKRRHRSSSSSSSSSSDSSRSSSSTSSSSSSSSGSSHSGSSRSRSHSRKDRKKRRKSKSKSKDGRERSLSPLSKRMAMMDNPEADSSMSQQMPQYNAPLQPSAYPYSYSYSAPQKESDYEQKVRAFIDQTKGDLDYEDKVRKFLEESARWKKEKKAMEDKASKKKKKKEKKAHDKEKSKKKKEKKKHRKSRSSGDIDKSIGDKSDAELEATKRKVDALLARRIPKHAVDVEEEYLYGSGGPGQQAKETVSREPGSAEKNALRLLNLEGLKDLDDLESKLNAYYAKVETTGLSKRHSSGSKSTEKLKDKSRDLDDKMDDDDDDEMHLRDRSPSPQRPIMSAKWKMQIPTVGSAKLKKKDSKVETSREQWDEPEDSQYKNDSKGEDDFLRKRKSFGMAKGSKARDESPDLPSKEAGMDRGRRSLRQHSRSRSRSRSSESAPKPPMKKKEVRSRSRSSSSRSRSRSRGRKYSRTSSRSSSRSPGSYKKKRERDDRSASPAGKKPGSPDRERYRSRSRSYKDYRSSRSRSRSGSYDRHSRYSRSRSYDRSRSRSRDYRRSRSPDRRRDYHGKYQGRFPRQRGTYYKPRFQNYKNPRGNFRGGRGFNPRYQNYRGRGFIPRGRGRGRGRFNNFKPGYNNRDYYNRDRRRSSRDRDSADRASSYEDDPMRKVNAEKDRINKYIEESGKEEPEKTRTPRRSEPLSEGEERDDDDYQSRQGGSPIEGFQGRQGGSPIDNFRGNHWKAEGKWADKKKEEGEENAEEPEDMEKFFSKVKASKEPKERKSVTKTWQ